MSFRRSLLIVAGLLPVAAWPAEAARIRYHFVPAPAGNGCVTAPAAGQRLTLGGWQAYNCPPPCATQLVTFRHPATGQCITVPLALPDSLPRMEYVGNRAIYNYGSNTVEVAFFQDGSVDAVYDSGLFRAP